MLSKIHRMAKQVSRVKKLKKTLEALHADGEAGDGQLRVRMNGARQLTRVEVSETAAASGDAAALAELVRAAVNDASRNLEQKITEHLYAVNQQGGLDDLAGRR